MYIDTNIRFYNKIKAYLAKSTNLYNSIRIKSFFPRLLLSYYIVITICICSMGVLSYNFVSSSIKDQSIISNDKLLNQFKNTVDSLILDSLNDFSLKILQDTSMNPEISYFFSNELENNRYGMVKVLEYCDKLKTL